MKNAWTYVGRSHQSVPSLSSTATRAGGGTNPADPPVVTRSRNSRTAAFAGPSFQEGSSRTRQWPAEIAASIRAFTWSTVKLAGSIRGGYSRNVLRNPPTMSAIG